MSECKHTLVSLMAEYIKRVGEAKGVSDDATHEAYSKVADYICGIEAGRRTPYPPDPIPVPCRRCGNRAPVIWFGKEVHVNCDACPENVVCEATGATIAEAVANWNAYNTPNVMPIDVYSWNAAIDASVGWLRSLTSMACADLVVEQLKKQEPTP